MYMYLEGERYCTLSHPFPIHRSHQLQNAAWTPWTQPDGSEKKTSHDIIHGGWYGILTTFNDWRRCRGGNECLAELGPTMMAIHDWVIFYGKM